MERVREICGLFRQSGESGRSRCHERGKEPSPRIHLNARQSPLDDVLHQRNRTKSDLETRTMVHFDRPTREDSPSPPPPSRKRLQMTSPQITSRGDRRRRSGNKDGRSSSVLLFERKVYSFDRNMINDGLRVVEEKAAAVLKVMKKEERELAENARGVEMVILDERGRRYSVFWRRRRIGANFVVCGAGWAQFAQSHRLDSGDVLRFCLCRSLPRESSGKLYLGVGVTKYQSVVVVTPAATPTTAPAVAAKPRSAAVAALDAFFTAPTAATSGAP